MPHPSAAQRDQLGGLVAAAAVGSPKSKIWLLVPDDRLAAPTVAFVDADGELPCGMAGPQRTAIEVPAVDVRTLLAGVDLLELDVEGQEHTLLSVALDHLRAHRPTIVVEVPGTPRLRGLLARLPRNAAASSSRGEPKPGSGSGGSPLHAAASTSASRAARGPLRRPGA